MPLTLHARRVASPIVEVATRGLAELDHPELVFVVREDQVPPQAVHWLAAALTEEVEQGERVWQADDTYRVGWSQLTLADEGDGTLVLYEETPQGLERGVWRLLQALGRMNEGLEGLQHIAPRYPHQQQLATVAGPLTEPLFLTRGAPTARHSGWRITGRVLGTATEQPLHQLTEALPALLQALALPVGTRVRLERGRLADLQLPEPS